MALLLFLILHTRLKSPRVPSFATKILPVKQSRALTYMICKNIFGRRQYTTSVPNMSTNPASNLDRLWEWQWWTDICNNQLQVHAWICARGIDADFFVVYVHMICACVNPLHSIENCNEESSREGKFDNQLYRSMWDKIFYCLGLV